MPDAPGDGMEAVSTSARRAPDAPRAIGSARSSRLTRPERLGPLAMSLIVHAGLIVLGFFVVWTVTPPPPEDRRQIIVSFENPSPAPLLPEPAPAATAFRQAATIDPPRTDAAAPTVALRPLDVPALASPAAAQNEDEALRAIVEQQRVPDVRFAGLGASNATDIVYVVDASGSMVTTLPIVQEYLKRSVSRLARTQRFQIIFFSGERTLAAPHPGDDQQGVPTMRLIRATPSNIAQAIDWTRTIRPAGRSNPVDALKRALWLKPDAVFLLGSAVTGAGEWDVDRATVMRELDALNPASGAGSKRRTLIKTIQFIENDPQEILRAIGEAHGGEGGYKFISREEATAR